MRPGDQILLTKTLLVPVLHSHHARAQNCISYRMYKSDVKSRFESVAALTGLADSDLNFEREILNLELLSTVILGLSR